MDNTQYYIGDPEGMEAQQEAINLLTQQVMELNNRLIAQQLTTDEDKNRMLLMEQQRLIQEGVIQEMRRQTTEMVGQAMTSSKPSLIDTRGLGKPPTFKSTAASWSEFSFKFVNWMSMSYKDTREILKWVAEQKDYIHDLSEINAMYPEAEEVSRQVYNSCAQLFEGEALTILQNAPVSNGVEMWRREVMRWDPMSLGRRRAAVSRIVAPGEAKMESLSNHIQTWEKEVLNYGTRTGKDIDDELKAGVLVEMAPKILKDHLYMNAKTLASYTLVRSEIFSYLECKQFVHGESNKPWSRNPDAMDTSGLDKGGGKGKGTDKTCWSCGKKGHMAADCWGNKGKGKGGAQKGMGKGGKGDWIIPKDNYKGKSGGGKDNYKGGKGGGKDGGKGKAAAFQGYCSYPGCYKWGHKEADCRKKAADIKAKGGANSLEHDKQNCSHGASGQPEEELGGFDLCSLDQEVENLKANNISALEVIEKIKATVDSGAAVTVMPKGVAAGYGIHETETSKRCDMQSCQWPDGERPWWQDIEGEDPFRRNCSCQGYGG